MKHHFLWAAAVSGMILFSCADSKKNEPEVAEKTEQQTDFQYVVDQFADLKILRYQMLHLHACMHHSHSLN